MSRINAEIAADIELQLDRLVFARKHLVEALEILNRTPVEWRSGLVPLLNQLATVDETILREYRTLVRMRNDL